MNTIMKMTAAYFDAKDFKYQMDEEQNVMQVSFGKYENKDQMKMLVFFKEDNRTVSVRSFEYCSIPENKLAAMHALCSELNRKYVWVKFFVDTKDNTLTLADDAIVMVDSCGDEIHELLLRMWQIGDDAYPDIMRTLWA